MDASGVVERERWGGQRQSARAEGSASLDLLWPLSNFGNSLLARPLTKRPLGDSGSSAIFCPLDLDDQSSLTLVSSR